METTRYVAGLLFDTAMTKVALIKKQHGPPCMIGKWNAIGGKCNRDINGVWESADAAMYREYIEEADVSAPWTTFLVLTGRSWQVTFYKCFSSILLEGVATKEDELVNVWPLNALPSPPDLVSNLRWIIPMALTHVYEHVWVYTVHESETFVNTPQTHKLFPVDEVSIAISRVASED